ncbi:MAG: Maf family protein [Raoultibacter sp.]
MEEDGRVQESLRTTETAADSTEATLPPIDIILASASPRRKKLLEDAGVSFTVRASDVDETLEPDLSAQPEEAAKKLAEKKAGAIVQEVLADEAYSGLAMVIGADTMVVLDNAIFGKPNNVSEATGMLRKLSGKTHEVITAVSVWCVMAPDAADVSLGFRTFAEKSLVTFKTLTDERIAEYLAVGESFDKAGAYAIQGKGAALVERVEGDLDTVVGLPVGVLLENFPELREC